MQFLSQLLTLIGILNYGKETENECFGQGLVGKDKKIKRLGSGNAMDGL